MKQSIFRGLRDVIYRESGISLSDEKVSLVSGRVAKRLRALGLANEEEYLALLRKDESGEELVHLIDAISTNVTHFYREPRHFEILGEIFDSWREEGKSEIKIWCAAASSGEEPYTIAITCLEHLDSARVDIRFLATDICTKVLNRALAGIYREEQLRLVPPMAKTKYFRRVKTDGNSSYEVDPVIKKLVTYKRLNLSRFPYPLKGPIDVIFCRNVMIYFDKTLRTKVISEFERLLAPDGYLFLSHAENLLGIAHNFETAHTAVYRKKVCSRSRA